MNLKIKNIKTIDSEVLDIYIISNKIYLNKPKNINDNKLSIIDLDENVYVSYGWIDSHVHCDKFNKLYYSNIDEIGYKQGVTTLIDCGSVGSNNIEQLINQIKESKTNVKLLLNISKNGIYEQSELKNLTDINLKFDKNYLDYVIGYKVRMSHSVVMKNGIKPLKKFFELNNKTNPSLPLMVHIGSNPPELKDVVTFLRKGDIITHIFNNKSNLILTNEKKLNEFISKAKEKYIYFDLGHGNDSFDFNFAKNCYKLGLEVDSISSDIYQKNIDNGTVKSLANVMSKMRAIGYSWSKIIEKVTLTPSKIFNLKNSGSINSGNNANLTFFKIEKVKEIEKDSKNNPIEIKERIVPIACIVNGKYYGI